MSVFVKTLSDLVALTLQSLRLAVLLPAAVIVSLNIAFILPQFQDTRLYQELRFNDDTFPLVIIVLFLGGVKK